MIQEILSASGAVLIVLAALLVIAVRIAGLGLFGIGLQIIGAATVIAIIVGIVIIAYKYPWYIWGPRIDRVTLGRARNLSAGGVKILAGEFKILRVVHSYEAIMSIWTGGHIYAYCLEIDQFPDEAINQNTIPGHKEWITPPVDNPLHVSAIETVSEMARLCELSWFPSVAALNSNRFYLKFEEFHAIGGWGVDKVQLVACDREERNIYYADVEGI